MLCAWVLCAAVLIIVGWRWLGLHVALACLYCTNKGVGWGLWVRAVAVVRLCGCGGRLVVLMVWGLS